MELCYVSFFLVNILCNNFLQSFDVHSLCRRWWTISLLVSISTVLILFSLLQLTVPYSSLRPAYQTSQDLYYIGRWVNNTENLHCPHPPLPATAHCSLLLVLVWPTRPAKSCRQDRDSWGGCFQCLCHQLLTLALCLLYLFVVQFRLLLSIENSFLIQHSVFLFLALS